MILKEKEILMNYRQRKEDTSTFVQGRTIEKHKKITS